MFQAARRLLACLVAALIIATMAKCGCVWANQQPSPEAQHWSRVWSPAVGPDGTIYVVGSVGDVSRDQKHLSISRASGSNYLYAVHPDGKQEWSLSLGEGPIPEEWLAPKLGRSGIIYAAGNHDLYAVGPDGAEKWKFPFVGEPSRLGFGPDDTIYFYVGKLLHVLKPDGTEKWKIRVAGTPAVGPDGTVYFCTGNLLKVLNPDGTQKWSFASGDQLTFESPDSGPILNLGPDGTVYVVGSLSQAASDKLYAPCAAPGARTDCLRSIRKPSDVVYAVNPNGSKKWEFLPGGDIRRLGFGPAGTIYVVRVTEAYALKADGTLNWDFYAPRGTPGLRGVRVGPDGTIYLEGGGLALTPNGTLKWQVSQHFPGFLGWEVMGFGGDGTVYILSAVARVRPGVLVAVSADGSPKWAFQARSVALAGDGTIYVADNAPEPWPEAQPSFASDGCPRGKLCALTLAGAQKWSFDPLCVNKHDGCPVGR